MSSYVAKIPQLEYICIVNMKLVQSERKLSFAALFMKRKECPWVPIKWDRM